MTSEPARETEAHASFQRLLAVIEARRMRLTRGAYDELVEWRACVGRWFLI